jgi:hypothetical protein
LLTQLDIINKARHLLVAFDVKPVSPVRPLLASVAFALSGLFLAYCSIMGPEIKTPSVEPTTIGSEVAVKAPDAQNSEGPDQPLVLRSETSRLRP